MDVHLVLHGARGDRGTSPLTCMDVYPDLHAARGDRGTSPLTCVDVHPVLHAARDRVPVGAVGDAVSEGLN